MGDLLGVFKREGFGEIDVVWGDKSGGLNHIINKHIGEGKSFSTIEEAAQEVDDITRPEKLTLKMVTRSFLEKAADL